MGSMAMEPRSQRRATIHAPDLTRKTSIISFGSATSSATTRSSKSDRIDSPERITAGEGRRHASPSRRRSSERRHLLGNIDNVANISIGNGTVRVGGEKRTSTERHSWGSHRGTATGVGSGGTRNAGSNHIGHGSHYVGRGANGGIVNGNGKQKMDDHLGHYAPRTAGSANGHADENFVSGKNEMFDGRRGSPEPNTSRQSSVGLALLRLGSGSSLLDVGNVEEDLATLIDKKTSGEVGDAEFRVALCQLLDIKHARSLAVLQREALKKRLAYRHRQATWAAGTSQATRTNRKMWVATVGEQPRVSRRDGADKARGSKRSPSDGKKSSKGSFPFVPPSPTGGIMPRGSGKLGFSQSSRNCRVSEISDNHVDEGDSNRKVQWAVDCFGHHGNGLRGGGESGPILGSSGRSSRSSAIIGQGNRADCGDESSKAKHQEGAEDSRDGQHRDDEGDKRRDVHREENTRRSVKSRNGRSRHEVREDDGDGAVTVRECSSRSGRRHHKERSSKRGEARSEAMPEIGEETGTEDDRHHAGRGGDAGSVFSSNGTSRGDSMRRKHKVRPLDSSMVDSTVEVRDDYDSITEGMIHMSSSRSGATSIASSFTADEVIAASTTSPRSGLARTKDGVEHNDKIDEGLGTRVSCKSRHTRTEMKDGGDDARADPESVVNDEKVMHAKGGSETVEAIRSANEISQGVHFGGSDDQAGPSAKIVKHPSYNWNARSGRAVRSCCVIA